MYFAIFLSCPMACRGIMNLSTFFSLCNLVECQRISARPSALNKYCAVLFSLSLSLSLARSLNSSFCRNCCIVWEGLRLLIFPCPRGRCGRGGRTEGKSRRKMSLHLRWFYRKMNVVSLVKCWNFGVEGKEDWEREGGGGCRRFSRDFTRCYLGRKNVKLYLENEDENKEWGKEKEMLESVSRRSRKFSWRISISPRVSGPTEIRYGRSSLLWPMLSDFYLVTSGVERREKIIHTYLAVYIHWKKRRKISFNVLFPSIQNFSSTHSFRLLMWNTLCDQRDQKFLYTILVLYTHTYIYIFLHYYLFSSTYIYMYMYKDVLYLHGRLSLRANEYQSY